MYVLYDKSCSTMSKGGIGLCRLFFFLAGKIDISYTISGFFGVFLAFFSLRYTKEVIYTSYDLFRNGR